jgi:hypothetical protein
MMSWVWEALGTVSRRREADRERAMEKEATGSSCWLEKMMREELRIMAWLMGGCGCRTTPGQNSTVSQ